MPPDERVWLDHRQERAPVKQARKHDEDHSRGRIRPFHRCNQCLIGMGSIVLDGAVLHDRVLLGAGSLVTEGKELEGGYLWLGRPAKKVRVLTEQELAWFSYSAKHYVRLKDDYLGR